jgi:hypothetical protein
MSQALSPANVKSAILTRLGSSCRTVEITDAVLQECITNAMRFWNQYESKVEYKRESGISTAEGLPHSVALPTDVHYKGIRAVYFLVPYFAVTGGVTIFELLEKMTITRMDLHGLAFARSAWENYRRIRGVDPTWHEDKDAHKLVFYAPCGPLEVGYELLWAYEDPTEIPLSRDYMFLQAVEAFCRLILAEIRGKFGGQVLAPGGGSFQLDAEYQRTRGAELLKEIQDKLATARPTMPLPELA